MSSGNTDTFNVAVGAAYGAVTNEENIEKAKALAKEKFLQVQKYAEEGDWTWKVLGLFSGFLMIGTSALSFISEFFGLSPFVAVLDIYIFALGVLSVCLEYKDHTFSQKYYDLIVKEAHFLTKPYGRGAFYVFIGILLVVKGGILPFFAGLFVTGTGAVIFHSSKKAYDALKIVRTKTGKTDVDAIVQFKKFDKDGSGYLDVNELDALLKSLGVNLNKNELETAVFVLDKRGEGHVSQEDFVRWWTSENDGIDSYI